MKPVLLTGATGFLGRHLLARLLAARIPVRALSRSSGLPPAVEIAPGDITSPADVDRAVQGASAIYHLAGVVSRNPADLPWLERVHVHGTRHLCDAAARHGVSKMVLVSTSGAIAVSRRPIPLDESAPYPDALVARWPYYVTKIAAEKLALTYPFVTVVNPALLLGPGDERRSSTGDIQALLDRQILALPTGGLCFVDVRDVAAATIAAMERGKPGERYLLGAANWDFRQLADAVGRLAGIRTPRLKSPTWLSLLLAPLLRRLMPLAGRRFDIDDVTIQMAGCFWYCDWRKAQRELDFHPRDPLETLRDTILDLQRHP
jgi:dihydroflavonol-4-reductase